ncbi:MAG: mechanosensitive ion channel domain-containing protein [Gammaproteobacteria bacterium]
MKIKVILTFFIFFAFLANGQWVRSEERMPIPALLQQWNSEIEKSSEKLQSLEIEDDKLKLLRGKLTEIRDHARSITSEVDSTLDPLKDELDALGPEPAEGEPKELASISKKRRLLSQRISDMEGQGKEVELLIDHTEKVLKQISAIRFDRFTQKTFTRGVSAVSPEIWRKAIPDLLSELNDAQKKVSQWLSENISSERLTDVFLHLFIAFSICWLGIWAFGKWVARKFVDISEIQAPTYLDLIRTASIVAGLRFLLPMALATSAYFVLNQNLELTGIGREIAFSVLISVLMVALVTAVSRALLSPFRSHRRLLPLNDSGARYLHKVIISLAWVFSLDLVLDTWLSGSGTSLELTVLRKFAIGMLIAGLLLALVFRSTLWTPLASEYRRMGGKTLIWGGVRSLIAILALMIPVSAIAGYVMFSRLLGTQIVLTGSLLILVSIVIALCSELIDELFSKNTDIGVKIRRNLALTEDSCELLNFWIKVAVKLIIYISALLAFLVMWGAGGEDITEWLYKAFFGFKVADVTVSIASILLSVALFSGILLLTRLLQNSLEKRVLPRTRIDYGIQHSIRASVGYIGFIVAALFAISTLGIDLGKLAIIAGALSVGIGFGLQNVVNNFVSGLILLIERPIKVGDWIVVGDKQGYVKKIKVRATEIQTFDRASVFIPNSDMISHPLLNWTHADKTARVIVPVGVAYGTETRKVQEILLEVAANHPAVFKVPAPSAIFKGFGDSSLNFELRAFIGDADKLVSVNSDLCFEIDAAFREQGIEIPYPQQDVHWKDIEKVENLVMRILSETKS